MQPNELFKRMEDFNRGAYKSALENIERLEEQTEKMMNLIIDRAIGVPEQGKNAARTIVSMYRIGFDTYKKLVEHAYGNGRSFQDKPREAE